MLLLWAASTGDCGGQDKLAAQQGTAEAGHRGTVAAQAVCFSIQHCRGEAGLGVVPGTHHAIVHVSTYIPALYMYSWVSADHSLTECHCGRGHAE